MRLSGGVITVVPGTRPEFVIWTPPFRDDTGGIIVLHELCRRLSDLGHAARIWPNSKPTHFSWTTFRAWAGYVLKGRFLKARRNPLRARIASRRDLATAIVIYPEIVAGNPLGARRVVRWLLHKPGYHTGTIEFGEHDLFFCFNLAFNDERFNPDKNWLRVTHFNPAYQQTNFGSRSGAAVLVRKGQWRRLDDHPIDAINVDVMTHSERAAVFNRVQYLYSYDTYSFHVVHAALCGCIPIVIPEPNLSEMQWQPTRERRLGIAYGIERIEWAEETRQELRAVVARSRLDEDQAILEFVAICRRHFATRRSHEPHSERDAPCT